MTNLIEQVLILIWKEPKIEIERIQRTFDLTRETTSRVTNFLLKFGFIEFDENNRYVRVSEPCKKFFDEDIGREKAAGNLAVVFL
jgi:DNA-binding MarR family transcriptional regulator